MATSCALPIVDLAPFFTGDEGGIARATEAMREACRSLGFFRAVNHGVPTELMARALDMSAAFFALPDEEKAKVRPVEGSQAPLAAGYGRHPAHLVDRYEYVRTCHPRHGVNLYFPVEPAGFRSVGMQLIFACPLLAWFFSVTNQQVTGHQPFNNFFFSQQINTNNLSHQQGYMLM
jgi:hypothetical protein